MSQPIPQLAPNDGTYRITGVPGAGKTTFLTRQIERAIESHGIGSIAVVSFTNAAATEIASRAAQSVPLAKNQVGTLHSFAYQAIGCPKLIEDNKGIEQWNEWVRSKYFTYQITTASKDLDELAPPNSQKTRGDILYAQMNINRNRLRPRESWSAELQNFAALWDEYKNETGGIDFTDMLEIALRDVECIPWRPAIGLHDEANDSSRLMLALWAKWARHMDYNIIAGDADQVLYSWAGVDVGAFLELPVPDTHKRYLLQSYRCPRAVVEYANRVIHQCRQRDPISMLPRDEEGRWMRISDHLKYPESIVRGAQRYLAEGKSVAFLTTCSYMLTSLLAVLRKEALPFENRYRRKRGDWNPLFSGRGTTAAERLLSFANGGDTWTIEELRRWIEIVETDGILARGAKTAIKNWNETVVPFAKLKEWFAPCWPAPAEQSLEWLEQHVLTSKAKAIKYPLAIAKKHGMEKLAEIPQITVGTIHSVKGATFDVVYLFPDLSPQAMEDWWRDRDSILRCWYVGATRSRETLIICSPGSPYSISGV